MDRVSSVDRGVETPLEFEGVREDLIRRVELSRTFEKSPRLRAFLGYVCQCALNEQPESATEQQIGIHVFNRQPGYNPSEDNVVRSQARLLRWRLEQYFAQEGKDEPLIIDIPKGQYLPVFENRVPDVDPEPLTAPGPARPRIGTAGWIAWITGGVALVLFCAWAGKRLLAPRLPPPATVSIPAASDSRAEANNVSTPAPALSPDGGIRIVAGYSGASFIDASGQRWDSDRYYEGGVATSLPQDPFPPVADPRLFRTLRESATAPGDGPPDKSVFAYNIPVPQGVYELRLYFADPDLKSGAKGREDSQNTRHFSVVLNGKSVLWDFDPVSDGGAATVDVRAFKDVTPEKDGMVHLQFMPNVERPFVNAIELIPGTRGKMKPIRISAQPEGMADDDGTRWSADQYFIRGRTLFYAPNFNAGASSAALLAPIALGERYGNFSYAIPVPPGSYTVELYFAESFFLPGMAPGMCESGTGCRVFDVTCNGVMLLHDFDVYKAAGGGNKVVVRAFHGLHPNGQGKLLLTFSPTLNYAEVRAIEVVDETK